MAQYHHRARVWTEALLDEMNLERSFEIYKDRFADASDFTFFFVGNIDLEGIRHHVKTYLGGLPATRRNETWRDVGIRPPRGVIEKTVHKGLEPKSSNRIVFTGPFEWSRKNSYNLGAAVDVLRIRLREVLREEMGGTYGVGVGASTSRYPEQRYSIRISFGCAPDSVEQLTRAVFAQIDSLKQFGASDSEYRESPGGGPARAGSGAEGKRILAKDALVQLLAGTGSRYHSGKYDDLVERSDVRH